MQEIAYKGLSELPKYRQAIIGKYTGELNVSI
jgi:hypothetical protein